MSNFCENCGAPLEEAARFCPSCGKAVAPQDKEALPKATIYGYGGSIGFSDRINSPEVIEYVKKATGLRSAVLSCLFRCRSLFI